MILSLTLVSLACGLFLLGGYMIGVRRALDARDALRAEITEAQSDRGHARADAQRLEAALAESQEATRREALNAGLAMAELERVQDHTRVIETEQGGARREVQELRDRAARAEAELEAARSQAQRSQDLRDRVARAEAELEAARSQLQRADALNAQAQGELKQVQELRDRLAFAEAELNAAMGQVKRSDALSAQTQAELKRLAATVAQVRETGRSDLREVERILSPLLEKERVAQAIQHIDLGRGTREELPRLLNAIANAGGLSALVLSDDSGLPLAASDGSERPDVLAGVWSQLLIVADRVVENGEPAPVGVRVLDIDGRVIAHRIFSAGEQRFLLTAVARAGGLNPESLEPAVAKLERVLMRDAWRE